MEGIASKCRYSDGYAAILARGFFAYKNLYPQDLDCASQQRSDIGQASNLINIYPNPVYGTLNIEIGQPFSLGFVNFFNSLGESIFSTKLVNQNTKINTDQLTQGTYFMEILLDGKINIVKPFIKI
jgi:hypothetical protein